MDETDYTYITVYLMKGVALGRARHVDDNEIGIRVFHLGEVIFIPWGNVAKVVEHG